MPEVEPGFSSTPAGSSRGRTSIVCLRAYAGLAGGLAAEAPAGDRLPRACRTSAHGSRRHCARLGMAGRVYFPGYVDGRAAGLCCTARRRSSSSHHSTRATGSPLPRQRPAAQPVVASNTSSLVELVREELARFDPYDVESIRSTITRLLTEASLLDLLRRPSSYSLDSWHDVAARTVAVYGELEERPRKPRVRRRPRVAYVSPLPPQRSGIADYSYRLLAPLSQSCELDAFVDGSLGEHKGPPGVHVSPISRFQSSSGFAEATTRFSFASATANTTSPRSIFCAAAAAGSSLPTTFD